MATDNRTLEELNAIVCALEETYPLAGIRAQLNTLIESGIECDLSQVTTTQGQILNDLARVLAGVGENATSIDGVQTSIGSLSTTITGLSNIQSDIAVLMGQVNAIPSTISSQIDSSLASGLADINTAVQALEAAAADTASAEDLQSIADAISENQADLDELLAMSEVYYGNVVINTPATLETFHAIGSGLGIVNGYVDIDVTADMDILKVQETVDFIYAVTGDFAYTATTGVDAEITFNNLTSAQNVTIDQEGGYALRSLKSATNIVLDDDSSVRIVDLRSLTSVVSLSDGTGSGIFTFARATELHLTSLQRSPRTALSLGVDTGGVIDISALRDLDSLGRDARLNLTLSGASTISLSNLSGDKAGSTITATDVETLVLNGYDGAVTIGEGVQNFSSDNLRDISITGNDLVTFSATGALDHNSTTIDIAGPALTLNGQGNLETVTLSGRYDTVTLDGNGNLETVTLSGNVTGAGGVDISNNSDLVNVALTGLVTDKVDIDGNSDLEVLYVDFTTARGQRSVQEGTLIINNNEALSSLTVSTNNLDNLTVTNNAVLETVDFTGLVNIGVTGTPRITITDNNLTASESRNLAESPLAGAGSPGDLGQFTTTSGLDTLKTYLTVAAADIDTEADVKFDLVDSVIDATGATEVETATNAADVDVLILTPHGTPAVSFSRVSWL